MHSELRAGSELSVSLPRNNFPLVRRESYLFIAGGIGITPFISMIEEVDKAGAEWRLLYGGRSRNSMAFLDVLQDYGDKVEVAPQDESGLLDLKLALGQTAPEAAIYACGPAPLLDACEEHCLSAERELHIERFSADLHTAQNSQPFEVIAERSGVRALVAPGQSIVDVLEQHGVFVDTSCRSGTCGTCETAVLRGTPEHRDTLLTDAEREENETMMICVGRALSPSITLDV
ncbi:2Fe-2S iron-sulfur cluster-binding protein [Dietzia cinnamea]|uniref:2Fe-2S iron-sulfur cluster-binding protein n=1 Tax=Dietzia cinnamea TaxID=321318 RepID=A0ABV3YCU6_9ACTN|nr:PDR/VanB family oxidoreductase [Dietzia sp. UCD-THP]